MERLTIMLISEGFTTSFLRKEKNMIPKIIHYCWFGRNPKPALAEKCIASWKKFCPDYEIIEWNEDNFDISSNRYVQEAYENRKYAFVTDYVRLYALVTFGGVYMDTDVEVVRSLDEFLVHQAFSGFEEEAWIPTGLMACEKDFPLYKEYLSYYDNARFVKEDGTLDTTTNTFTITKMTEKHGLIRNGQFQIVDGFALYPREVFCPLDNSTGVLHKNEMTAAIHWFSKSWLPADIRVRSKITRVFHRVFGINCFAWLKKLLGKERM